MSMGVASISYNKNFDPTAMFKKLDANSDGGIDKDEFLANIKKQEGDTDEKLLKMFEETDTDSDGKISEAENTAVMKKCNRAVNRKVPRPHKVPVLLQRVHPPVVPTALTMMYAIPIKTVMFPSRRNWHISSNNLMRTPKQSLPKVITTSRGKRLNGTIWL